MKIDPDMTWSSIFTPSAYEFDSACENSVEGKRQDIKVN